MADAPLDGTPVRAGTVSAMSIGSAPMYPLTSRYIDEKWQAEFSDGRWAPYDPQPNRWQPITPNRDFPASITKET